MDLKTIQGATRPAVTLLFALTLAAGFLLNRISPDQFIPVATMALGYWFGSRQSGRGT